jgi:glycosyltransferase involved in cell wall biosynthesis
MRDIKVNLSISVIICTHNPKSAYFDRVLHAIRSQTLPMAQWELLVVDNASVEPVCEKNDISWHPLGRHLLEEKLGLTPARLCGIKSALSDVLVFVDDDNILEAEYLEHVLKIANQWPMLGAWGGQAVAEFEEQPPEWTKPFWCKLAIREFEQDKWSNLIHQDETTPYGAGLCVRKTVAQKYAELVQQDPKRNKLGRTGKALTACEDIDLAYTACDLGLGTGIFSDLKLTHIIPPNRLQEEYLLRLIEGLSYSGAILESFRGKAPLNYSWKAKLLDSFRNLFLDSRERRFKAASFRGLLLANQEINSIDQ